MGIVWVGLGEVEGGQKGSCKKQEFPTEQEVQLLFPPGVYFLRDLYELSRVCRASDGASSSGWGRRPSAALAQVWCWTVGEGSSSP